MTNPDIATTEDAAEEALGLAVRVTLHGSREVTLRQVALGMAPVILIEPTPEGELGMDPEDVKENEMHLSVHVSELDAEGAAVILRGAAEVLQRIANGETGD